MPRASIPPCGQKSFRLALTCLLLAGCSGCQRSPDSNAKGAVPADLSAEATSLKQGDLVPDLDLELQNKKTVRLSSFRGKNVLLYFYPKDNTPGCTLEAQQLRDHIQQLKAENTLVLGVSTQDAASHVAFIEQEQLPFDLVMDVDGRVAKRFGVPVVNGLAARQSFLIDPEGRLKRIWRSVSPAQHAEQVLLALKG